MSLPVPEKPDFGDKLDEPITELELEIKKVMAQRNYDIEQINRNNKEIVINNNTNWLKSQETSVKNEKIMSSNIKQLQPQSQQLQQQQLQQQPQLRYIKIDNNDLTNEIIQNDLIDINNDKKILSPKKQVSWNNNINYENENQPQDKIEDDFLKKLKTIKPIENNSNEINKIKEELKTFNTKLENLTQNVNAILELLQQKN
jgi:hypothetical protein